jgi:transcriptional regulator with XRE-family HTH domain
MDAKETVAVNIRRLRVARGVSQDDFAVDAGIDRTYVSRLERKLENPTVLVLERIARALDVPITELFKIPPQGHESPPPLPSGRKKAP